jgi:anti-anti-sigma factor
MSAELKIVDDKVTCQISTNILASIAPELRDKIVSFIETNPDWKNFELDLENVEKIDSIGVNLIVGLYKTIQIAEKEFKVINCQDSVFKVLKLFRLQNHFSIEGKKNEL